MAIGALFDRHHRIERFAVLVGIACSVLIVSVIGSSALYWQNTHRSLGSVTVYGTTSDMRFSLTDAKVSITGVYKSSDSTKAMIVFSSDDFDNLPSDASDYSVFVTSANVTGNSVLLSYKPAMSFYVFGASGYYGLYLSNADGIPSEVLDIVVRDNNPLIAVTAEEDSESTFDTYDQLQLYINPGASDATVSDALDDDDDGSSFINKLCGQLVLSANEATCKETLANDLDEMIAALKNVDEYKHQLITNYNVQLPEIPETVANDKVTKNDDGTYTTELADIAGQYDVDWQNASIYDGIIEKLKKADGFTGTDDAYIASKSNAVSSDFSIASYTDWVLVDGTVIGDIQDTKSDNYKNLVSTCSKYVSAWQNYYSYKKKYLTEDVLQLIHLEQTLNTLKTGTSVCSDTDHFIYYNTEY